MHFTKHALICPQKCHCNFPEYNWNEKHVNVFFFLQKPSDGVGSLSFCRPHSFYYIQIREDTMRSSVSYFWSDMGHAEVLETSFYWGALTASSLIYHKHIDLRSPCIHCLGEDFNIRPLFRINCMSDLIGKKKKKKKVENKTKAVLQNSYPDPILFSIYANNIEWVAWSSLSFQWLYHFVFCKYFIVLSYKWAITEF